MRVREREYKGVRVGEDGVCVCVGGGGERENEMKCVIIPSQRKKKTS